MSYDDPQDRAPKSRGFSGKAALLKTKRDDRLALIDSTRCTVCQIPMTDDVKTMWCKMQNCPRTNKRGPNATEAQSLGMGSSKPTLV